MISFNSEKIEQMITNFTNSQIDYIEEIIKTKKNQFKSLKKSAVNDLALKDNSTKSDIPLLNIQFKISFMLGVPCAGKGTLCSKLIESFPHLGFISAGDCLREARNNQNNPQ